MKRQAAHRHGEVLSDQATPHVFASAELGSAVLFFISAILPILFVCFAFMLDLSRAVHERQLSEQTINDAALYAYRYLPFEASAKTAADNFLKQYTPLTNGAVVTAHDGLIEISLAREIPLHFFARLFPAASIRVSRFTRVRGTPFDVFIALDRSEYMAPSDPALLWGNEIEWPALSHPIPLAGRPQRFLAQQCFNPNFSALKRAAIGAYDYMSSFPMNAVGVGIFPGKDTFLGIIRTVELGNLEGEKVTFIDDDAPWGTTRFCAAAAGAEASNLQYSFPNANGSTPSAFRPSPEPRIIGASGEYNPDHSSILTVREALWSQVAKGATVAIRGLPDTAQLISQIAAAVVGPAASARKGLANEAVQSIFILAGDVPYAQGQRFGSSSVVSSGLSASFKVLRDVAEKFPRFQLRLYYVLMPSPVVSVSESLKNDLQEFFGAEAGGLSNLKAQLIVPAASIDEALSALLIDRRSAILSCTGGMKDCEENFN